MAWPTLAALFLERSMLQETLLELLPRPPSERKLSIMSVGGSRSSSPYSVSLSVTTCLCITVRCKSDVCRLSGSSWRAASAAAFATLDATADSVR